MKVVNSWDEVPSFSSEEEEEVLFWDTHSLSPRLWAEADDDPELGSILADSSRLARTVKLDPAVLDRLTSRARREGVTEEEFIRRAVIEALKSA